MELRESHRHHKGQVNVTPPSEGDVVIVEEDKPRGLWRLGRITKLITGRDGYVRGAVLRISGNNVLQRPIQKLYPLEVMQPREPVMTRPMMDMSDSSEKSEEHCCLKYA